VNLQHAEAATEVDLLLRGDTLVAEHDDMVLQVRAVDAGEVLVVDRMRQVQADDLGTYAAG
jgi:hypothetical protein